MIKRNKKNIELEGYTPLEALRLMEGAIKKVESNEISETKMIAIFNEILHATINSHQVLPPHWKKMDLLNLKLEIVRRRVQLEKSQFAYIV